MSERVDVAAFVPTFPATSETFIVRKLEGLAGRGLRVRVVAGSVNRAAATLPTTTTAAARGTAVRRNPATLAAVAAVARNKFGATRRAARALRQAAVLLGAEADTVHFEFSGIGVSYLDGLALLPHLPVVVSCRGAAEQIRPLLNPERAAALRVLFARSAAIHCVSDDMARLVSTYGAAASKIVVNRPAVDPASFRRSVPYVGAKPPALLLSVGRLHWKKGYDIALAAIRLLLDRGVDLRYDIIGEGVERERLAFTVQELGLGDVVRLLGAQKPAAVREALESASLFLLPSLSEGISNSVLEAMSMEVPVVSTLAGGMGEVITDGEDGFLCPSFDPSALAGAIRRSIESSELRDIGANGRLRIEAEFSIDRQIDVFLRMYQGLASSHGARQSTDARPEREA